MKKLALENYYLEELSYDQKKEIDGGIIPLIAIGVAWGVMVICSAVCVGIKHAAEDQGVLPRH